MNKARRLLDILEDGLFGSPGMIFPESAKYAGILFTCMSEGFFLHQPAECGEHVTLEYGMDGIGIWTWPGGNIDNGEQPYQAALRECQEEIGFVPEHKVIDEYLHGNGYITYLASVDSKFNNVKLNNESMDYGWYSYGDLPTPTHDGVIPALDKFNITGLVK